MRLGKMRPKLPAFERGRKMSIPKTKQPYGFNSPARDGAPHRCINSEPGAMSQECGKAAVWIGTDRKGARACFCDGCRNGGAEAADMIKWEKIE